LEDGEYGPLVLQDKKSLKLPDVNNVNLVVSNVTLIEKDVQFVPQDITYLMEFVDN
jgi:hypothetical protein